MGQYVLRSPELAIGGFVAQAMALMNDVVAPLVHQESPQHAKTFDVNWVSLYVNISQVKQEDTQRRHPASFWIFTKPLHSQEHHLCPHEIANAYEQIYIFFVATAAGSRFGVGETTFRREPLVKQIFIENLKRIHVHLHVLSKHNPPTTQSSSGIVGFGSQLNLHD